MKKWYDRCVFMIGVCLILVFAAGCGKGEKQREMGRYAEREVELPGKNYSSLDRLADGGYILYAAEDKFAYSTPEGEIKQDNCFWRNNANIYMENSGRIAEDGSVFISYIPKIFEEGHDFDVPQYYSMYIDASGDRHPLDVSGDGYQRTEQFYSYAFAPDNRLYVCRENGRVDRLDVETGKLTFLFQAEEPVEELCFYRDIMMGIDKGHAYFFDVSQDILLEGDEMLDEFVAGHRSNKGISIALDVVQGEDEANDVLYLACRTGIYQYVLGGSVIEQIADGQLLTLGNSYYELIGMQAMENKEFRMLFSGGKLVEAYYDETLPSKPEKELFIYSLREDDRIRYGAQLFQKQNPEVLVRFETGIEGDYAVEKEDALKNLNTRILAGEVPDILLLDGMDIDQYVQKGVLASLDDTLSPYLEDNLLYENIIDTMRMPDSSVYAVPLTVMLPFYYSDERYMSSEGGLSTLLEGARMAREEHPENTLFWVGNEEQMLNRLLFVSLPAWLDADKHLDVAKVEEFYEAAAELWELENSDGSDRSWILEETKDDDYKEFNSIMSLPYSGSYYGPEHMQLCCGILEDPYWAMQEIHVMTVLIVDKYEGMKEVDPEWGTYNGQAENVFWAQSIMGICEKAKEPELATEFLELMLSEDIMNKFWLNSGIPIRRSSVLHILDIDNHEFEDARGWERGTFNKDHFWGSEEEQGQFLDMLESASTFYQADTVLEGIAREIGVRVLKGELTPQEGAREVEAKMSIALSE